MVTTMYVKLWKEHTFYGWKIAGFVRESNKYEFLCSKIKHLLRIMFVLLPRKFHNNWRTFNYLPRFVRNLLVLVLLPFDFAQSLNVPFFAVRIEYNQEIKCTPLEWKGKWPAFLFIARLSITSTTTITRRCRWWIPWKKERQYGFVSHIRASMDFAHVFGIKVVRKLTSRKKYCEDCQQPPRETYPSGPQRTILFLLLCLSSGYRGQNGSTLRLLCSSIVQKRDNFMRNKTQ